MPTFTYPQLRSACSPAGPSALTSVTELAPAGGPHAGVAPARYVDGNTPTFAYESRFVDGRAVTTVILDSKQSQGNRIEAALFQDIRNEHPILGRVPRMQVSYLGGEVLYTDLELPHRAFDGHIRAGTVGGESVTANPSYRAARDASPAKARALLELSPGSLVFGSWDSTRKTRQGRYRSALVGEIIGVIANQEQGAHTAPRRGGARVDPVGMSVQLSGDDLLAVMSDQRDELSPKLIDKIEKAAKRRGERGNSGSVLGLGGIPPTLDNLGVVACSRIIRTHVLSFAALRQLRFGSDSGGDVACRALLAAYGLAGLARSDSELNLRANCDLVETAPTAVKLDSRGGDHIALDALSITAADEVLAEALAEAERLANVDWRGQVFEVIGNPAIYSAATAESAEE
jgi:CRISPR-associated protein Csb1